MSPVDAFRAGLTPDLLATVDALRAIVAAAHPDLAERIKWNAPSFAIGDDDRLTLGLERKGGVRLVLHRGVKAKDAAGFVFGDPDGLATWPAVDRGIARFSDAADVAAKRDALLDLCARWIAATT